MSGIAWLMVIFVAILSLCGLWGLLKMFLWDVPKKLREEREFRRCIIPQKK